MAAPKLQTTFVDVPDLFETFSDSIKIMTFDGESLRIEFAVTRPDDPAKIKDKKNPTAKQYPVCRLVLSPSGAIELINQITNLRQVLERDGALKTQQKPIRTIQ